MPITAKLSRQFYDKLGDEAANELVDWLNAVDQSYRDEFRDLFEANFGRVEARLREMEARFGQSSAELRGEMARMEARLIRWMFVFWVTTWLAVAGTMLALQRLH